MHEFIRSLSELEYVANCECFSIAICTRLECIVMCSLVYMLLSKSVMTASRIMMSQVFCFAIFGAGCLSLIILQFFAPILPQSLWSFLKVLFLLITLVDPTCIWMHWAMHWCHSALFVAISSASSQLVPVSFRSYLTMSIQFLLGRRCFLLYPLISLCITRLGILKSSILNTCLSHLSLLSLISTFIRQYGRHIIKDTGQTYKCNQAHTHRQAHPIKTIKQTNSYRRLTASVAKCLST